MIHQPEDWYSVKLSDLWEVGFPHISRVRLTQLLEIKYPNDGIHSYDWDKANVLRGRFSEQKRMERTVRELFPVNVVECYGAE